VIDGSREIEGGVLVEKSDRDEGETRVFDGHDWPVLGAWDVGDPKRVPQDDIFVNERAISRNPLG
jgi:hypothetical protein